MTPGKARSAPVALAPAMRPCLLACVPSWTFIGRSRTRCQDSTQSPAAKTPSWPGQRWWSSTRSAPLSPSSRPAVAREGRRGAHAGGHDDVVGGQSPSPSTRTGALGDLLQLGAEAHVDADALGRVLHVGGHVLVERRHHLAGALDQRHPQAALHERLGHLEADVAAADDDRALAARPGPRAKRSAASIVRAGSAALGARDRRRDGLGAGGEHELVEALAALVAELVAHGELAAVEVDGRRPRCAVWTSIPCSRCSSGERRSGRRSRRRGRRRRTGSHMQRRRLGAALERHHVEVGRPAAGRARGAHPRRIATHDRRRSAMPARYPVRTDQHRSMLGAVHRAAALARELSSFSGPWQGQ